jgi:anti-anti-sigma factor
MQLNLLAGSDHVSNLECADDLTLLEVQEDQGALERLLGQGCYGRKVLLSLAGTRYVDSAGIGWLIVCHKRFQENGGRLVLHSLPPLVGHIFDLLGLRGVLNLAADEPAARALVE